MAVRDFSVSVCLSHPRIKLLSQTVHHCYMSRRMTKPTKLHERPANTQISLGIRPVWSESSRMPRLIWVLAGRTFILLVLSWGGSYIKLPSSGDFRSQWPPESRRVPRECNCWRVCSYIDAQELLLQRVFFGCSCIYKHFVETKNIVFRFLEHVLYSFLFFIFYFFIFFFFFLS